MLGRGEEATQAWEKVLERDPASLEAMEQLLQLYMAWRSEVKGLSFHFPILPFTSHTATC